METRMSTHTTAQLALQEKCFVAWVRNSKFVNNST